MNEKYSFDIIKLVAQLSRFTSFVHHIDGHQGFLSFRDSSGFLGREEDYKSRIAEEARKALNYNSWDESWIGTGNIANCAKAAISKSGNLVNMNQQVDFKNRLDPDNAKYRRDAERALYDIYRNPRCDEADAFANAVKVFGAKYDTIAFLFFIKDDSRFLPISTGHFDKGFSILGSSFKTSFQCSWENYRGFISIISEVRSVMEDMLPMQGIPRLIDAHSFIWIIQQERFTEWVPGAEQIIQIEQDTEQHLANKESSPGGRRNVSSSAYIRSAEVSRDTKKRAKGICQFCNQPAPFIDKKGNPHLEVHHIIWLSRGGEDSTDNTAAICPNCHARMHILDKPEDIEKLKKAITSNLK